MQTKTKAHENQAPAENPAGATQTLKKKTKMKLKYPKELVDEAAKEIEASGGGIYYAAETGRPYSLRNQALLALQGAPSGAYAAFHTARKMKLHIRKGVHGFGILFYGRRERKPEDATDADREARELAGAMGVRARITERTLVCHTIFHIATQTEPLKKGASESAQEGGAQ